MTKYREFSKHQKSLPNNNPKKIAFILNLHS